jgi:RNase_H superfamily
MITRSQKPQEFYSLPEQEKPIVVSCFDLFSILHNDAFSIIVESKHEKDEDFQRNKWSCIISKSKKSRELATSFLYTAAARITEASQRKYMGLDNLGRNLEPLFTNNCLYMHKYYFKNKSCHVDGAIDALYHKNNTFLDLNFDKNYICLFFCQNVHKISSYLMTKSMASLYYFSRMYSDHVETDKFVFVDANMNTVQVLLTENDISNIKSMVQEVRKTKKLAPYLDLVNLENPKYFPNMKFKDSPAYQFKKQVAFPLGEITNLWNCDDTHRQLAFQKGITSWRDSRFSPELLGWPDQNKKNTLQRILSTNRQNPNDAQFEWIRFEPTFKESWPMLEQQYDWVFIDFEWTLDHIYMIGIYSEHGYQVFWASELSETGEQQLLQAFNSWYKSLVNTKIWYWHAEKSKWKSSCQKHELFEQALVTNNWHDLCAMMRNGVAVYGALDFGLKSVVEAFYKQGKIPFTYNELECQNGLESIEFAEKYYKTRDQEDKESLEKYNKMDCEAMFHIFHTILEEI